MPKKGKYTGFQIRLRFPWGNRFSDVFIIIQLVGPQSELYRKNIVHQQEPLWLLTSVDLSHRPKFFMAKKSINYHIITDWFLSSQGPQNTL